MKNVGKTNSNFDLDLEYGRDGENTVLAALNGAKKVEVKTDKMAHYTQQIAVEYMYKGRPSGISTTEADYWAFLIPQTGAIIMLPTSKLKEMCKKCYKLGYVVKGGDFNASKMIFIPIWMLVQFQNI